MEKIKLKPLLICLVLLAGILGWQWKGRKIFLSRRGYLANLKMKKEEVRVVSLTSEGKTLEIKREGSEWKVKGKKAKEMLVNDLLAVVFPQEEPELVAKTASRHSEMGVDEGKAIKIKIDGKEIWLGKEVIEGNYLRIPGKDEVWLVKGRGISPTAEFSYWADRTIIFLEQSKAKKLIIKTPKIQRFFEQKEGKWYEGNKEVKEEVLKEIFLNITPFTALGVVEDKRPSGYHYLPDLTLELEWEEGKEKLEFFKGKEDWIVRRDSDGTEFIVSSSTAEKFFIK